MNLLEFYSSLPTLEQVSSFYVPGYTEALKTYLGVRVIPDATFLDGLDQDDVKYLKSCSFPVYFIPLMLGNNCYGYVLKGREKRTPRKHTKNVFPGQCQVLPNEPVCLVEGIKDSYLLRALKIPTIPMLTSEPCDELLSYFEQHHCPVIFIPDNDIYREQFIKAFKNKISTKKIPYYVYKLEVVKDLGDYFLPELREPAMNQAKRILKIYRGLKNAAVQ